MKRWWLFFLYLTLIGFVVFSLIYNSHPNAFWGDIIKFSERDFKIPTYTIFGLIWLVAGTCFIASLLTEATERAYDGWSKRKIKS